MAATMAVVHALYYLAEAAGWRSGLHWRLGSRGVYSPELAAMLARGQAPRPPRDAIERVKSLVNTLCGSSDADGCGYLVIAAAKIHAMERLGISYEETHITPPILADRLRKALQAHGLLAPRKETIITPVPRA